jgi:hypothetical protein
VKDVQKTIVIGEGRIRVGELCTQQMESRYINLWNKSELAGAILIESKLSGVDEVKD